MRTRFALLTLILLWVTSCSSGSATPADRAALVDGVTELSGPCCSGQLLVMGETAFPVILGTEHEYHMPVVAATRVGKGRAVAFAHPGYFDASSKNSNLQRLILNAVTWVAGDRAAPPIRVGVYYAHTLAAYLRTQNFAVTILQPDTFAEQIRHLDVICGMPSFFSRKEQQLLPMFLQEGGGLLLAEKGGRWHSEQRKPFSRYPGNLLLGKAGILWMEGDTGRPDKPEDFTDEARANLCRPDRALVSLQKDTVGPTKLSSFETGQAIFTIMRALMALPDDDRSFRPKVQAFLRGYTANYTNLYARPVLRKDVRATLLLAMQTEAAQRAPVTQVKAHPSAAVFPGAVSKGAPRINRTIRINTAIEGWHSTGLYAAPGEIITVEAPRQAIDLHLSMRIGAHTDTLWHFDVWRRAPAISRSFPLTASHTKAANAFGGLIYIEVPDRIPAREFTVTIRQAVAAPYYVWGKTTAQEWQRLRQAPAPWAELAGRHLILTVPSEIIRAFDDPERVMQFWEAILKADADLAGLPHMRTRPERICPDEQISAGYMHSGYPIMTLLDVTRLMIDPEQMKADNQGGGAWGFFHELGHNYQSPDWNFEGTGEVTCNLFTLYDYETVCGVPAEKTREQTTPEWRTKAMQEYFAKGADFIRWQEDPFLGLIMYLQLKEAFGWEAYKKVFTAYRDLPEEQRPKSDAERRDQWLTRFSRAVGRNLGPFFTAWGIPTSETARESLRDLPEWRPEGFPPKL